MTDATGVLASSASTPRPFIVSWRIRDAVFVVLWTDLSIVGCILVLALVLLIAFKVQGIPVPDDAWFDVLDRAPWFDLFLFIQSLLMVFYFSRCIRRSRDIRLGMFVVSGQGALDTRYALRLLGWCVLISLTILVVSLGLIVAVAWITQQDSAAFVTAYFEGVDREAEVFSTARIGWLGELNTILIGPPIEELVYRGCLYAALRKRLRPWQANVLSSGAFALSHHYVLGLPTILAVGIASAYAYERTRSLRVSMVFHMLWNTLCAAAERPWLWFVFVLAVIGLFAWARWASWRAEAAQAQPSPPPRSWWWVWWKGYAWCFVGLSLLAYLGNPTDAWKGLVELPAYLALMSYAYRKAVVPRACWVVYGLFYAGWVITQLSRLFGPDVFQQLAQDATAEGLPAALASGFAAAFWLLALWGVFLVLAPAVIVLWRLATTRG